jgi:hypothetical protein
MAAAVRVGVSSVAASAIIQADSTTQGLLPPRMTTAQRDAIASPATGLVVYNTTTAKVNVYNGSAWVALQGQEEIVLGAGDGWPSTTAGCAAAALAEYGTNKQNLLTMDFDQTTQEHAEWTVWLPATYNGSTISFIVAWTAAAGTAAQTVEWNLQARAYANDDAIDQAWGTAVEVSDALIATGDMHYTAVSGAVTIGGGPAAGEVMQVRVYRDVGGDTLAADAKLIAVRLFVGLV